MSFSIPSIIQPKNQKLCLYIFVTCSLVIFISLWISMSIYSDDGSGNYSRYLNINRWEALKSKSSASDYNKLINISFSFNLMSTCGSPQPELLVMIHSAPGNFEKRKAIRETWGQNGDNVKVLFALGMADTEVQRKIEEENAEHKDFVQGSFIDTYHNLTYKHVMVLKYAVYHCSNFKFLLKADDDVFVNMPNMRKFLKQLKAQKKGLDKILCSRLYGTPVLREGQWAVEESEYPDSIYPNYCLGFVILYPRKTVFSLYFQAQKTKYFWIDDVHITGTLAKKAGITHIGVEDLILTNEEVVGIVDFSFTNVSKPFLFGRVNLDVHQIRTLSDFVVKNTPKKSMLDYLLF